MMFSPFGMATLNQFGGSVMEIGLVGMRVGDGRTDAGKKEAFTLPWMSRSVKPSLLPERPCLAIQFRNSIQNTRRAAIRE